MSRTPAQILMSHGGTQHHGNAHDVHRSRYAEGGSTVPVQGAARANAEGGLMGPMSRDLTPPQPFAEGGMRRGGRRHHWAGESAAYGGSMAEGGEARAYGGAAAEGGKMRRGGRRHSSGDTVNPKTGHPQYFWPMLLPALAGLAGSILPGLLSGAGQHEAAVARGGAIRRGGRRHHDAGDIVSAHPGHPGYGLLNNLLGSLPLVGPLANLILAEGGSATAAEGGKMRRGGRRRHHAEGNAAAYGGSMNHAEGGHAAYGGSMAEGGMRRGGRRHHWAGESAAYGGSMAEGGEAEGGKMRRGGRRRYHAEGGSGYDR